MSRPVLVAGIGNIFLGDDGFGCEVVRHLSGEVWPVPVRVVDYGIRGTHLAYDLLDGYDALVLVDAMPSDEEPGTVTVIEVTADHLPADADLDAHDMNPVAVLVAFRKLGGVLPPTYVVGANPESLEESIGLSAAMAAAVPVAARTVLDLVGERLLSSATSTGGG